MNTNDNRREARVRAAMRLRKLTIGTALIGVAATGGFGALAAVTYGGTSTTISTTTGTTANTTRTPAQALTMSSIPAPWTAGSTAISAGSAIARWTLNASIIKVITKAVP